MSKAFRVLLDGAQAGSGSSASGLGTVLFNSAKVTATYKITVSGLDFGPVLGLPSQTASTADDVHGVHVHSGPSTGSGGVVFGQREPESDNDDFFADIRANGSTTFGGVWETTDPAPVSLSSFAPELNSAAIGAEVGLYWNIHTTAFGGGEIRGQWVCIADDAANTVDGTAGDDWLPGLGGADDVFGKGGRDSLDGGAAGDRLYGDAGNDILRGEGGNDRLAGGAGRDVQYGGKGADRFVFRGGELSAKQPDVIKDFDASVDEIDLSAIDADASDGADQDFVLVSAFSGTAGEAVLQYDAARDRTTLQLDTDGADGGDMAILINGEVTGEAGLVL
ncbi:MAG TPA: CHRD domain-containing protein [Caulobacteraceae bacterium]|jgi:hypothetical protein